MTALVQEPVRDRGIISLSTPPDTPGGIIRGSSGKLPHWTTAESCFSGSIHTGLYTPEDSTPISDFSLEDPPALYARPPSPSYTMEESRKTPEIPSTASSNNFLHFSTTQPHNVTMDSSHFALRKNGAKTPEPIMPSGMSDNLNRPQAHSSSIAQRSPTFESSKTFEGQTMGDAASTLHFSADNSFASPTSQNGATRYEPSPMSANSTYARSGSYLTEKHPLTGHNAVEDPSFFNTPSITSQSSKGSGIIDDWKDSTPFWLAMYFAFNLGLTLFNKIVLVSFPFPYTLTGLHALSGCAGCYIAQERGVFIPARLTSKENLIMTAFSVLYTINIAVSNLSLNLVTVPFHQVVRASTPLFTILISSLIFKGRFSAMKLVSLLPVVAGVGFATYGDYYFTAWGLILTLIGTFLAALKTVVTNVIQTGGGGRLKLHPLDLLLRMSPLAFIQCVIYGWYSGELERVRRYGALEMTSGKATALLVNGIIAFGLNVVSFTANKKAGALTMTVSANCKQVLTIAIAVIMFNLHINLTNAVGILLTLIGGAWYGYIEYLEKARAKLGKIVKSSA